jgi:hypothetical protein
MPFFKNASDFEKYFEAKPNLEGLPNTVAHCLRTGILGSDKAAVLNIR